MANNSLRRLTARILAAVAGIVTAVISLTACSEATVYDRFQPVEPWYRGDTVSFGLPPMTGEGTFQAVVGLRVSSQCPFTSVAIIAEQRVLPADTVVADTLRCRLFDDQGRPVGHGTGAYSHAFRLTKLRLCEGDSLAVSILHNMRRDPMTGILDVGVKLIRVE